MNPANDPTVDYRLLVMRGYDQCAREYESIRASEIKPDVALFIDKLEEGAKVLDLGCGAGVPIAKTLAEHFEVTGVDFSREMILRARKNVPHATFIHADFFDIDLPGSEFDAAVSFYAIFHLSKKYHKALFQRIYHWLKIGGYLLITVARENGETYSEEFLGVTMYWSNYSLEEYIDILCEVGFTITQITSVGHGYKTSHETPEEDHPLILARKT